MDLVVIVIVGVRHGEPSTGDQGGAFPKECHELRQRRDDVVWVFITPITLASPRWRPEDRTVRSPFSVTDAMHAAMKLTLSSIVVALLAASAASAQPAPKPTTPPPAPPAKAPAMPPAKAAGKTTLTWHGHAAFKLETPSGKTLLIDPWLSNPTNPTAKDDVKAAKADLILITHGHSDHVGDAIEIGKRTKAKLVATFDLARAVVASGYPAELLSPETAGNVGGTISALDGEVAITFVPAVHSSHIGEGAKTMSAGSPGGFVIAIKGGPTVYHTGDTDVFGDMAQISRFARIDLMLTCIGGHFTMDPARAAEAVRLVKPRQVAPMHYGTFPMLKGTPAQLGAALKKTARGVKMIELKIGTPITL